MDYLIKKEKRALRELLAKFLEEYDGIESRYEDLKALQNPYAMIEESDTDIHLLLNEYTDKIYKELSI